MSAKFTQRETQIRVRTGGQYELHEQADGGQCHSRAHAEALCKYLVDGLRWHSAGCIDAEAEAHIEQLCDANPHA